LGEPPLKFPAGLPAKEKLWREIPIKYNFGVVRMPHDLIKNQFQPPAPVRVKVALRGAVQGVGFRPFVHRLATELALTGWVNNSPQGVLVEVESQRPVLEQFLRRLQTEKPPQSFIQSLETTWLDAVGFSGFEIRASDTQGDKTALVLPDIATCPDCLREILDPHNRRFRYPFTNCTNCGPRFSIIESLPYDRANTAMKKFAMCPVCQFEYDNPPDRRFHAQPNACPVCGPQLEFWRAGVREPAVKRSRSHGLSHEVLAGGQDALLAAAKALREGKIVAVKGIGGFHLLVDARNETAVQLLRERKHREEKPFALLFPTLESVRTVCEISPLEERLLLSPEAPIVLLAKIGHRPSAIGNSVAPGNPNLGVMLPSNPIHHLLMAELGFPVVATSGNLSDEPLCTDELEAVERLRGIADFFLVHNRPIVRHVDDSIVRVMLGREMVLRRARGFAPLPVAISVAADMGRLKHPDQPEPPHAGRGKPVLAVGAHLKNAVALAVGKNVFLSQHIGDLETVAADQAFRRVIADFQKLYEANPETVAADLHPDYLSTKFARECGLKFLGVQHHIAHVLSCIAENEIQLPALGVAWDGTGYGTDGTIWGGEFFLVTHDSVERVASLRPFRLPGSNAAVKEPRRAALGMLFEMFGDALFERHELAPVAAFSAAELALLKTMLGRGLNSPKTSSVGRWFDAVAAIVNLRQQMAFEGQAAMELEFALAGAVTDGFYQLPLVTRHAMCILDWAPMLAEILLDVQHQVAIGEISAKFHNTLAETIVAVARRFGHARVALSGGCFQNRCLLERTVQRLGAEKFQPYWHQRVPTNDGGIALGQVMAAFRAPAPGRS
jgi:hydrogenase maturation protein HypF